jgi:hypothetical protein
VRSLESFMPHVQSMSTVLHVLARSYGNFHFAIRPPAEAVPDVNVKTSGKGRGSVVTINCNCRRFAKNFLAPDTFL